MTRRKTVASANPVPDDSPVATIPRPLTLVIPPDRLRAIQAEPPDTERRPMAAHTSYSQLSMYLRCSMQYYFRYVVNLKEKPKVSLSIGKGGHAALEWNTKSKLATGTDREPEDIISKASDMMDHYMSEMPPSEYEADVEPGALKDKFLAATRIYATRDAPKITPIAAEVEYNLDINKYIPDPLRDKLLFPVRPVNLKIDVIEKDTETMVQDHDQGVAVEIDDYKFAQRKVPQLTVNISPQITTYITAIHDLTGRWVSKAGIRMMNPGSLAKTLTSKSETPDSIRLLREPEHMTPEALKRRMVRVATQFAQAERGIAAGIYIPVDDPITCSWCGFRDRCQASLVDDYEAQKIRDVTAPR